MNSEKTTNSKKKSGKTGLKKVAEASNVTSAADSATASSNNDAIHAEDKTATVQALPVSAGKTVKKTTKKSVKQSVDVNASQKMQEKEDYAMKKTPEQTEAPVVLAKKAKTSKKADIVIPDAKEADVVKAVPEKVKKAKKTTSTAEPVSEIKEVVAKAEEPVVVAPKVKKAKKTVPVAEPVAEIKEVVAKAEEPVVVAPKVKKAKKTVPVAEPVAEIKGTVAEAEEPVVIAPKAKKAKKAVPVAEPVAEIKETVAEAEESVVVAPKAKKAKKAVPVAEPVAEIKETVTEAEEPVVSVPKAKKAKKTAQVAKQVIATEQKDSSAHLKDTNLDEMILSHFSVQQLQELIDKKLAAQNVTKPQEETQETIVSVPVASVSVTSSVQDENTILFVPTLKKKTSKKASSKGKQAQIPEVMPLVNEFAAESGNNENDVDIPIIASDEGIKIEETSKELKQEAKESFSQENDIDTIKLQPVEKKKKTSKKAKAKKNDDDVLAAVQSTSIDDLPVVDQVTPADTPAGTNEDTPKNVFDNLDIDDEQAYLEPDPIANAEPAVAVVQPQKKKRGRKPKSAAAEVAKSDSADEMEGLSDADLMMMMNQSKTSAADKKNAKALAKHAALTKNDTMKQYMGEIGVIPLVSKEQEIELASQIHGADFEAQEVARDTLIMANLRLVVKIAHDFKGLGLPLLDLISEGNLGLMRAVMKFDPEKGAKFSSYAAWWIKQSMRRALANQSKTIRIPVQSAGKINKIKSSRVKLAEELGREPTDAEIANNLDYSERTVSGLRLADLRTFSLHDPIQQGEEGEFQDIIPDRSAMTPERILGDEESKNRLKQILDELDERERQIIRMRFGIDYNDGQGMTLEEVSQRIGRTRERVRQIQNQALAKLRNKLADEAGFNND